MALGGYPKLKLKAARKARDAAKLQKTDGINLVRARKVEKLKAARADDDAFKAVAIEWCGKQSLRWHDSHADRMLTQFKRDLFPWIGERTIAEIHAMELLAAIKKDLGTEGTGNGRPGARTGAAGLGLLATHSARPLMQHHVGVERPFDALQGRRLCSHP